MNDHDIASQRRSHRIGLIVPSSNTNVEPDFQLLAPDNVTIHSVRSGGYDVDAIPDSAEMRRFVRQSIDLHVSLLRDARVDVLAYGCTSATLSDGPEFDQSFCAELERLAECPATTAAGALIAGIRSVGALRVAFTSPYVPQLRRESVAFLEQSGIQVLRDHGFDRDLNSLEQNALTPKDAYDMALAADHPDADAIVISCTDYRAVEAITAIEAAVNKPVVTSNQALMYALLSKLGCDPRPIRQGGRLFTREGLSK
ncbi:Asp/Glu racemase [Phaeobacter sp.]|uniref:maleate cis-trans isomerase family protein n=1 Tax=Phaeobacter sp. TaxID=1902409 RepID=UPI00260030FB|nr:Asp/Glu racemase [Phaeobacter sp.]